MTSSSNALVSSGSSPNSPPYWMTVEYLDENNKQCYKIIHSNDLIDHLELEELYTGKIVHTNDDQGNLQRARIAMVSETTPILEDQVHFLRIAAEEQKYVEDWISSENEDFDASGSDWEPEKKRVSFKSELKNKPKPKKEVKATPKTSKVKKPIPKKNENKSAKKALQNISAVINNSEPSMDKNTLQNVNVQPSDYKDMNEAMQRLRDDFKEISLQIEAEGPCTITGKKPMCNKASQTDTDIDIKNLAHNQSLFIKQIQFWGNTINDLRKQVEDLKETIETMKSEHASNSDSRETIAPMDVTNHVLRESNQNGTTKFTPPYISPISSVESFEAENNLNQTNSHMVSSSFSLNTQLTIRKRSPFAMVQSTPRPCDDVENGMVTIGTGRTIIPKHIYDQIKWNSYTSATRKLLMAVFPRRTLATHSLTGKSSPAFSNRPAKMKLDPKKIQDIIITVSEMCQVPSSLVRNTITVKCSDENKMYKVRMEKMNQKKGKKSSQNQENENPGPSQE